MEEIYLTLAEMPWGFIAALLLLLALLIWLTDRLACDRGILMGLAEAERRNRQQSRYDYDRGVIDGARRVLEKGLRP